MECPVCGCPVRPATAVCPECGVELANDPEAEFIREAEEILDLADYLRDEDDES